MKRFILAAAVALAGCASQLGPQTPEQLAVQAEASVYQLKGTSEAIRIGAVTYLRLPRCSQTVPLPCSQSSAVEPIQRADRAAKATLDAAEAAVRTPGVTASATNAALAAAKAAMTAFSALMANYGVAK